MSDGLVRALAVAIVRHASRRLSWRHGAWAEAMRHEVDSLENDLAALQWAVGCVIASYVERINPMKAASFAPLMGFVALSVFIFGAFYLHGGNFQVLIEAIPTSAMAVVLGALAATAITTGGLGIIQCLRQALAGRRFGPEDFRSLKSALTDVFADKKSALIGRNYSILYNPGVARLITNARDVTDESRLNPDQADRVLQAQAQAQLAEQRRAVRILRTFAHTLLWFGLIAFLLSSMNTMISMTEFVEVIGGMVASSLTAPLLGVFLAAGIVQPLANRLESAIEADARVYEIIRTAFVCRSGGGDAALALRLAFAEVQNDDVSDGVTHPISGPVPYKTEP